MNVSSLDRFTTRSAGLLAAAVALGTGEFVASLFADAASPVVAVGDAVIDLTPGDLAREAIAAFGTADKPALVVGTVLIALLIGVQLGRFAAAKRMIGDVGFLVFGGIGVFAASRSPVGGASVLVPSVLAAVAGIVTLRVLLAFVPQPRSGSALPGAGQAGRRVFLGLAGAAAVASVVLAIGGRRLRDRFSAEQ